MAREWERALERQLSLLEYSQTTSQRFWLHAFNQTLEHKNQEAMGAEHAQADLSATLGFADTFYVAPEMVDVMLAGAKGLRDQVWADPDQTEPILERHIPFSKAGFVYFAKGIPLQDKVQDDTELTIRAMAWREHKNIGLVNPDGTRGEDHRHGIMLWAFGWSRPYDATMRYLENPEKVVGEYFNMGRIREEITAELREAGEEASADRIDRELEARSVENVKALRETLDNWGIERFQKPPDNLLMVDATAWGYGIKWEQIPFNAQSNSYQISPIVSDYRRIMYSLWSLMAQPLAAPQTERGSRTYRRRWERQVKTAPNYGDVKVVKLRRLVNGGRTEGVDEYGKEWSHRWIVRGHWHKYHTRDGVVLRWLEPYVKGPSDKPLIVKDKIYEVIR